jgi:hypothetical protein
MLIVLWAGAHKSVEAIEDGTAGDRLVQEVLASEAVAETVSQGIQTSLEQQFEGQPLGTVLTLLDSQVNDLLNAVLTNETVSDLIYAGTDRLTNRLFEEMTDPDRAVAPFALSLDPSARINERIDEIPLVGPLVPDVQVRSIDIELIPAETFEDVRAAFFAMKFVGSWFLWFGLALMAGGLWASPVRARFGPRALLVIGLVVASLGLAIQLVGPNVAARFVPGGPDGGLGTLVNTVLSDSALPPVRDLLVQMGLVSLALAGVYLLLQRIFPALRHDKFGEGDGDNDDEVSGAVAV